MLKVVDGSSSVEQATAVEAKGSEEEDGNAGIAAHLRRVG